MLVLGWIRFAVVAVLLLAGAFAVLSSVVGVSRFRFALNRMHVASVLDTFGLLFLLGGIAVAWGLDWAVLKLVLVLGFVWTANPISSHLLSELEVYSDPDVEKHAAIEVADSTAPKEKEE